MKLIKIIENDIKEYDLIINYINIITFDKGLLNLPATDELSKLTILFKEKGVFTIKAGGRKIKLGNMIDEEVATRPGEFGFNTQPTFIHCDNIWFILSTDNFIFPELEENKND